MESSQQKFPPNPRDGTNFLSRIFFTWTIPLFAKGYKKVLQMEDMYRPLKCDNSDLLGDRLEEYVEFYKQANHQFYLFDKI